MIEALNFEWTIRTWVDLGEIEFSCALEQQGAQGFNTREAAALWFVRLEQVVDGLAKGIGLMNLRLSNNAIEMFAIMFATSFMGSSLDAHHIGPAGHSHLRKIWCRHQTTTAASAVTASTAASLTGCRLTAHR